MQRGTAYGYGSPHATHKTNRMNIEKTLRTRKCIENENTRTKGTEQNKKKRMHTNLMAVDTEYPADESKFSISSMRGNETMQKN